MNHILPLYSPVHTIPSQTGQCKICVLKHETHGFISFTDLESSANQLKSLQAAAGH